MILECPYCEHEFDLENWGENLDADSWIEDVECPGCEEYFDIYVEFKPRPYENKINMLICDNCGKGKRDRYMHKIGRTFPYPKKTNAKILCDLCYWEIMQKEMEDKDNG